MARCPYIPALIITIFLLTKEDIIASIAVVPLPPIKAILKSPFDSNLFNIIRESQLKKIINPTIKIKGSDKAPSAIEKTKQNLKNANLIDFVEVERNDFFQLQKETEKPLHILTNPPYGKRLEG